MNHLGTVDELHALLAEHLPKRTPSTYERWQTALYYGIAAKRLAWLLTLGRTVGSIR